jgi:hypothetical protein
MNKTLQYFLMAGMVFFSLKSSAQNQPVKKDTVVQLYGVVMSADSLRGLDATSVIVEGTGRGTITNDQGVFSIGVLKGDTIRFTSVGFKDAVKVIPKDLKGNMYDVIQLMVNDTAYLPAMVLKPRPSRAQFERDFVNTDVPADALEIARKNNDAATRKALLMALPSDGREAYNSQIRQQAAKSYYTGQQPPMNIFNPAAWAEFIQAWKRGDFKRNSGSQ